AAVHSILANPFADPSPAGGPRPWAMLTKRIIPCLDVDRGRVVKGVHFLQLRDAGDPVEVARRYEADGADELVFLDISASHEGREIMLDVVRRVSEEIFMPFTVGGGIRSLEDATRLIQAGAEKVSINSAAVRTPVVASGGAGSPEHLYQVLTVGGADAALAASIFHYNEYGIPATKAYLAERRVPVRITARTPPSTDLGAGGPTCGGP